MFGGFVRDDRIECKKMRNTLLLMSNVVIGSLTQVHVDAPRRDENGTGCRNNNRFKFMTLLGNAKATKFIKRNNKK